MSTRNNGKAGIAHDARGTRGPRAAGGVHRGVPAAPPGKGLLLLACALLAGLAGMTGASGMLSAAPLENRFAVFSALDKITGEITTLRVPIDEVARFGTFRIRPRTCHTRPPTEEPRTMAFIEIDEITYDRKRRRIFSGWMNAESPGLHAVEHPLFDVWLTGCQQPLTAAGGAAVPNAENAAAPAMQGAPRDTSSSTDQDLRELPLPPLPDDPRQ